jgi:hypothetical protein
MRRLGRGLAAGAVGTAALDLFLFARYRREGGESSAWDWESSAGLSGWEQAPAPAQLGKRIVKSLFGVDLPPTRARLVNNTMHWGYGIFNGAMFAVVSKSLPGSPLRYGLPFGAAVWSGDYVILPALKLYKPIWEYDAKTLANDLSGHLVYGLGTAGALTLLGSRVAD